MNRRRFLSQIANSGISFATTPIFTNGFPVITTSDKLRPKILSGVQSGDITKNSASIWSRSDRAAQMIVEYSTTESFKNSKKILGGVGSEFTDFTVRLDLDKLPPGQKIFYRVAFRDLQDSKIISEPMTGSFNTTPNDNRWNGDAQKYNRNDRRGLTTFAQNCYQA